MYRTSSPCRYNVPCRLTSTELACSRSGCVTGTEPAAKSSWARQDVRRCTSNGARWYINETYFDQLEPTILQGSYKFYMGFIFGTYQKWVLVGLCTLDMYTGPIPGVFGARKQLAPSSSSVSTESFWHPYPGGPVLFLFWNLVSKTVQNMCVCISMYTRIDA